MKFRKKPLFAALTLVGWLSGNAHAALATDSLNGWAAVGDAVSASGKITLTTAYTADGDAPYNLSGNPAELAFSKIAPAAGVGYDALAASADDYAVEGSLISQSFGAVAGQSLSFDWLFTTRETRFLDHAFVVINGAVMTLATTATPGGSAAQGWSFTFAQSGNVALSFGVVDTVDADGVSALTIGNLQLSSVAAVPEPSAYALLLSGFGVVGLYARRRRLQ